jgi:hypothetical protein
VLSVLLRYTDSDYPFGIFKLFLNSSITKNGYCLDVIRMESNEILGYANIKGTAPLLLFLRCFDVRGSIVGSI